MDDLPLGLAVDLELGVLHVLGDVLDHAEAAQVLAVTTSLNREGFHIEFFFRFRSD